MCGCKTEVKQIDAKLAVRVTREMPEQSIITETKRPEILKLKKKVVRVKSSELRGGVERGVSWKGERCK